MQRAVSDNVHKGEEVLAVLYCQVITHTVPFQHPVSKQKMSTGGSPNEWHCQEIISHG